MIDLQKIIPLKRRRKTALLGLTLDGNRLDGVVLKRTNGALQLQQSFSVTLTLDPLPADPELVAREIRNLLDAAGVHERYCVVGVPLKWALTVPVELPDLPEADLASFLQIEAERGFPTDVTTLRLANSQWQEPGGKKHATLIGLPANQLAVLEQVLAGAKLKPVSLTLGITALQPPAAELSNGVLALVIGETHVGLQVTGGGGVAALRALEGAIEDEAGRKLLNADLVARETRITLGQLPAEFRATVRRIRIFGSRDLGQQLVDELELRLETLGLEIELVTAHGADEFGVQLPPQAPVTAAFNLAARPLARLEPICEFLPPKVTIWKELATKYSSGRLRTIGAAAAGVIALVGSAFLFQQVQLATLRTKWETMAGKVHDLDGVQQQIRQYRSWYDESCPKLNILRQLTLAFPEDGSVSAKTIEVREPNLVTCSGIARDNPSLLRMLGQLRNAPGVADLKVTQIRGKKSLQFTFDFHWQPGGNNETR